MISKELLSTVLGIEVINFSHGGDFIEYSAVGILRDINIFELANKCKEWAFNKGGIDITSGKRLGLDGWECLVFVGVIPCDCYEAETEPQAIFKACQWILENR